MPDFIAVDEINSQVTTSESNIVNKVSNSESNVRTILGSMEGNIQYNINQKAIIRWQQRGTFYLDYRTSSGNKYWDVANVTLNGFTNLNKMIVLIDGNGADAGDTFDCYLESLTTTKATFSCLWNNCRSNSMNFGPFSYQVIEFY